MYQSSSYSDADEQIRGMYKANLRKTINEHVNGINTYQ